MSPAKRALDLTLASVGLVALGPAMLGLGWLVRRDTPGPALHRAGRVGLGGREFSMYKFRTMVADASALGPGITRRNDPRVTRLGRRLRATKLDELPQLINVLRGEMSLVGPRPEAPEYVALYPPSFRCVVEEVRPGLFGLSQLVFRDEERTLGERVHDEYVAGPMRRKLLIDRAYVRRRGFWLDLALLVRSAVTVARR